jgi:hypothetical protein
VKLPDPPELALVGELVARTEAVACADAVGYAARVAVAEGLETARCVADRDGDGVEDAGADEPASVAKADAEPAEADPAATLVELDPNPAHAVRPAPPIRTAMITTGTRRILIAPTLRNQTLQQVTIVVSSQR